MPRATDISFWAIPGSLARIVRRWMRFGGCRPEFSMGIHGILGRAWVCRKYSARVAQMVTGKVSHTVQNKDISTQTPGQDQRLDMALFRAIARDLFRAGTSVCFEAN